MATNAAEKAKAEAGVILHRVARQGLPERKTSEHRLEQGEWRSHVASGSSHPGGEVQRARCGLFQEHP